MILEDGQGIVAASFCITKDIANSPTRRRGSTISEDRSSNQKCDETRDDPKKPLRTELGQHKVQGQDFAYTINGWLKAMNGSTLDKTRDIGGDGNSGYLSNNASVHSGVARDINAYTVGYFEGDYTAIGTSLMEMSSVLGDDFHTANNNLYNGNIAHLVTSIYGMTTLGTVYSYDQLQRLTEMTAFKNTNTDNTWTGIGSTQDYYNAYTYDRNGNILTLQRNGTASTNSLLMDDFTYDYTTVGIALSNRLDRVRDTGLDDGSSQEGDIKSGMTIGNFRYDKLGQLTEDASEEIQSIEWRKGDNAYSIEFPSRSRVQVQSVWLTYLKD